MELAVRHPVRHTHTHLRVAHRGGWANPVWTLSLWHTASSEASYLGLAKSDRPSSSAHSRLQTRQQLATSGLCSWCPPCVG